MALVSYNSLSGLLENDCYSHILKSEQIVSACQSVDDRLQIKVLEYFQKDFKDELVGIKADQLPTDFGREILSGHFWGKTSGNCHQRA